MKIHCVVDHNACCEHFSRQAGAGFDYYQGSRHIQKGGGLGSILSGIFRGAVPLLSNLAKKAAPHVLRAGARTLSDIASGKKLSNSLVRNTKTMTKDIFTNGNSLKELQNLSKRKPRRRASNGTRKKFRHSDYEAY